MRRFTKEFIEPAFLVGRKNGEDLPLSRLRHIFPLFFEVLIVLSKVIQNLFHRFFLIGSKIQSALKVVESDSLPTINEIVRGG